MRIMSKTGYDFLKATEDPIDLGGQYEQLYQIIVPFDFQVI